MDSYQIRVFGDPVLKRVAEDIEEIDGGLVKTCDRMLQTMYGAPGIGLAAPQVGISKRFFDLNTIQPACFSHLRGKMT